MIKSAKNSFFQARSVEIETWRAVPIQVDGEPLLVNPFKLRLQYFKSAFMLTKKKTSCKFPIDKRVCTIRTSSEVLVLVAESEPFKYTLCLCWVSLMLETEPRLQVILKTNQFWLFSLDTHLLKLMTKQNQRQNQSQVVLKLLWFCVLP